MSKTATTAQATAAAARSGILAPSRPDKMARMAREAARRGPFGAAATVAAIRYGDGTALVDELGTLTYVEIDERSNALANAWMADGIKPGDTVAILCRNHRGFADATYAAAKAGLRAVYMNTEFAGPQIDDVCKREGVAALIFDEEYDDRAPDWAERHYRAWTDSGDAGGAQATLEELIASVTDDACRCGRGQADRGDAHQRHDGNAEGRAAKRGGVDQLSRRLAWTAFRSAPAR